VAWKGWQLADVGGSCSVKGGTPDSRIYFLRTTSVAIEEPIRDNLIDYLLLEILGEHHDL
jgi:hypothetical protein